MKNELYGHYSLVDDDSKPLSQISISKLDRKLHVKDAQTQSFSKISYPSPTPSRSLSLFVTVCLRFNDNFNDDAEYYNVLQKNITTFAYY